MKFDSQAMQKIASVLHAQIKERGNTFRLVLDDAESGRRLSLEIFPEMKMGKGKGKGTLISVYTSSSHLQLHYCTGYEMSESLGEVIFVAENHGRVTGLIIVKDAGCSFFANVDADALTGDFTKLAPEVMPSAITLSVTEELFLRKKKRVTAKKIAKKKTSSKRPPAARKRSR
ncbi:MAG: hypothetical protein AAB354_13180 [candidate division KSB1 bacterium]